MCSCVEEHYARRSPGSSNYAFPVTKNGTRLALVPQVRPLLASRVPAVGMVGLEFLRALLAPAVNSFTQFKRHASLQLDLVSAVAWL
jgi:hypothetical protein